MHACRAEPRRLAKHLVRRQRAHPSACIRNDAVGAEVVAAVLYFKEGTGTSLRNAGRKQLVAMALGYRRRLPSLHRRLAALDNLCAVGRAAYDVDFSGRPHALRVDLREAAARRNDRVRVVPTQLVERADILVVRDRRHRAGVDNDRVRAALDDLVSALGGQLRQRLRFEQVDLAAERKESKFHAVLP